MVLSVVSLERVSVFMLDRTQLHLLELNNLSSVSLFHFDLGLSQSLILGRQVRVNAF